MVTNGIESKITAYIQSNPQYKEYSREKVVSIMLEKGALTRSEVQSWYRQMEERVKEEHAVSAEVPSQPAKTKTNNQANTSIKLFGDTKPISSNSDMGLRVESAAGITPLSETPNIQAKQQTKAAEPLKFELTEEQAKNEVINTIMEDVSKSYVLYQKQDNGVVSKGYDALKNYFDSELSSSNVEEALALQATGADNLMLARDGELTKREYYLQNKEHLKKMLTRRLYDKDENTGLDFLDRNRGKLTKEEFAKFLEDYIQRMIDNIPSMDSLKSVMHGLVTSSAEETEANLQKLLANAKKNKPVQVLPDSRAISIKSKGIPLEFDTEEPISFEEVFRYERGTQYSKEKVENVIKKEQELTFASSAVNKHAQFKTSAEALIKSEESAEVKRDKVAVMYEKYYGGDIGLAKEKLDEVISQGKFMIVTKEVNGKLTLDMSAYGTESQQQNILNLLLRFGIQQQDKQLEKVLGGKPEDKMLAINQDYEAAYTNAYGNEFTEELVQAMENDNKSFIRKYTGGASMAGMAMTVVGGILCFTPAAPLGAGLITAGNTLAIGGMAAESALGYTEALTREEVREEELEDLSKQLIMNAGGFVVGYKASKLGMKAFNKLVDKKLTETFKTQITDGNRAAALKEVFSDPQKLGNFMEAAGAKIGTDFLVSYAGDLAMMGVLDTQDDWESLLKANLMGIIVGTSSDVSDIGKLAYRHDPKAPKTEIPKIDLSDIPISRADAAQMTRFAEEMAARRNTSQSAGSGESHVAKKTDTQLPKFSKGFQKEYDAMDADSKQFVKDVLAITGQLDKDGYDKLAFYAYNHEYHKFYLDIIKQRGNMKGNLYYPDKVLESKFKDQMIALAGAGMDLSSTLHLNVFPDMKPEEFNGLVQFVKDSPELLKDFSDSIINYWVMCYKNNIPTDVLKHVLENNSASKTKQRFGEVTMQEMLSCIKDEKDTEVLKYLVATKGVNGYEYNSSQILEIMQSAEKKAQVLDALQNKSKLKKSDLTSSYKIKGEKIEARANENYVIKDYPLNTPKETVLKDVPAGEVAQIGGKLYANDGEGNLVEIKMKKETFERLFPQKDKFEMHQGMVGDCYLVSAIDAMMNTPKGRISIYRLFEEKDGDMYVKFSESGLTIKFNDSKPVWLSPVGIHKDRGSVSTFIGKRQVDGCDGVKILEQAYALQRNNYRDQGVKNANDIFFMTREMQKLESGGSEACVKDITKRENSESTTYYCSNADYHKKKGESFDDFIKVLEKNDKNTILFTGFDVDDTKRGLVSGHAYRISSYDAATQTVGIVNPWNTGKEIKIPLYELSNIMSIVTAVKINTSFENDYGLTTHQTPVRSFQAEDRGVAATLKSENSNSAIASLRDKMFALKDVDGSSMFSDAEMNFIRENYTTQDIQRLDRVIDKLSELYSDVEFPDVDVRNSFTSIITNPYFKSTKDFQFVEDVLNFKSDPETLYDAMYEDIFLNLSEDNINAMKTLMEISKNSDNSLLKNIHNIRYIVDVMSQEGMDRYDIETAFTMKDENGNPVLDRGAFDEYCSFGWKSFKLPLSEQKIDSLKENIRKRFKYVSEDDLNNIIKNIKDSSDARYLNMALNVRNADGDCVFNLDTIDALCNYLTNNPSTKMFLNRLLPKLERTSLRNMDAPLNEIFTYVKDKPSMYLINELIKPFNKQSDINWRVIGMICHNINTMPDGKSLESLAVKLSKLFVENEDNLYILSQVNDTGSLKLLDKMLNKASKNISTSSAGIVTQLTPIEMSKILGAYHNSEVPPEELSNLIGTAIDKSVAPDLITRLPAYKAHNVSDDVMNFIIDTGSIKDEKGEYKFSQYGIDAILDASNGNPSILNYAQNLIKNYPDITTKQIIDNINGKSISLNDKYEYPFGEHGEFREQYEKIMNSEIWQLLPANYQGPLFNYLKDLVNKDPNRFVRLVESGYFELAMQRKVDINDLVKNINTNKFFSKHYLEDVKRISNGESPVKEFPSGTDIQTLSKSVPEGEVGSVDGKLYVNDNGQMIELKLDKETFERLFPLEGRFNTQQKGLGDCWLISAIDNLMDLPAGRAKIYQMFSQNGNDIQVTLPNKTTIYDTVEQPDGTFALEVAEVIDEPYIINLPGGKIPNNGAKQVQACDGVKMLEFAYSVKRSGNKPSMTPYEFEELADVSTQMQSLEGGHSREFISFILGYTKDQNNNYFNADGDIVGGVMSTSRNINAVMQMIKATANDDRTLLHAATLHTANNGGRFEKDLSPAFDLYSNHAYTIKGYDDERGMIYFTNPWNSNTVVEMDVYTFLKYIDNVNYMRL